jgi:hypothetical protein
LAANYYHIGILVKDIDEAIERFSRVFQIAFNPPASMTRGMTWHGHPIEETMRVSYSTTEPFVELIECAGSGYFSCEQGEGVHHVGIWSPEHGSPEWNERFGALAVEASIPHPDGRIRTALTDPASLHNVRLELIDEADRAAVESWIMNGTALTSPEPRR